MLMRRISLLSKRFSSENKISIPKFSFINQLEINKSNEITPMFRVLDKEGEVIDSYYDTIDKETALRIFNEMIKISIFDNRLNMAQREGKISFYMTCIGEEAAVVGSIAALEFEDMIFPQYREAAALLYRGFSTDQMINQLVGNYLDNGKGRQMPIHYGSKKLNYQTVSSPLATQIPHASGAGYHYRVRKENKVALTYFGEGAASEGDFHSALNFASTLKSQTIFFCRNNGYAISTNVNEQYGGDGIVKRGIGYGISSVRVDGNDVLAVYSTVKKARELSISQGIPVLIEAMSFRGGDHSTSDASKAYRTDEVLNEWKEYISELGNPITRFENYLIKKDWITTKTREEKESQFKVEVREALKRGLALKKPSIESMFDDVYKERSKRLKDQYQHLSNHLEKYGDKYDLSNYNI